MPQSYAPEFKKKIVRLHEEEGRTYKSITAEYGVSKASISKWCSEFEWSAEVGFPFWFDWRRIYLINTSFKKLERRGTMKHTMYIWIPVRKIFPNAYPGKDRKFREIGFDE